MLGQANFCFGINISPNIKLLSVAKIALLLVGKTRLGVSIIKFVKL